MRRTKMPNEDIKNIVVEIIDMIDMSVTTESLTVIAGTGMKTVTEVGTGINGTSDMVIDMKSVMIGSTKEKLAERRHRKKKKSALCQSTERWPKSCLGVITKTSYNNFGFKHQRDNEEFHV